VLNIDVFQKLTDLYACKFGTFKLAHPVEGLDHT